MKLMIASDIHGSGICCRALVDAFDREQADKLLLLGDILYHGPRNDLPAEYGPKAVIALLNPLSDRIVCVRGNCDAEVDQMVLDFPIMADYALLEVDGVSLFATHGHHFSPAKPPKLQPGTVLLNGHTHVPAYEVYDEFIYVNPGSTSIPKSGSEKSYLILENGVFTWKTLEGTVYRTENVQK